MSNARDGNRAGAAEGVPAVSESPCAAEVWFDAVLHPHRSLSPFGFLILMIALAAVSFTTGIAFLMAGAWPVFGFFGLDVALVYLAFRANYRSGQVYETLRLTRGELAVRRVLPGGDAKTWTFQPYWLRVEMDDPPRTDSELRLSSHGQSLVIGSFLTPAERLEVARALGSALARTRRPEPVSL
jgi:uncharacterized membrane protein